jgi:hypothetical protein
MRTRRLLLAPIALVLTLLGTACTHPSTQTGASSPAAAAAPSSAHGTSSARGTTAATTGAPVPRFAHVVVVVMENRAYRDIIGNPQAPYLDGLARKGLSLTQSFAVEHPSQPNYLALFAGSTQGISNDSCPHTFAGPNLGSALIAAGDSFTGYSESLPAAGYTGCTSGSYARKHNPWADFGDLPSSVNQPFSAFPRDYTRLPTVSFVIPNLDHDMHDGTVAQGDQWLRSNVGGYASWAVTNESLLIVTWDEDDGSQRNQICTILTGADLLPGTDGTPVSHYSLLRTLEDAYGLAHLGSSANVASLTGIWQ